MYKPVRKKKGQEDFKLLLTLYRHLHQNAFLNIRYFNNHTILNLLILSSGFFWLFNTKHLRDSLIETSETTEFFRQFFHLLLAEF